MQKLKKAMRAELQQDPLFPGLFWRLFLLMIEHRADARADRPPSNSNTDSSSASPDVRPVARLHPQEARNYSLRPECNKPHSPNLKPK